jgi:hypothetical protein
VILLLMRVPIDAVAVLMRDKRSRRGGGGGGEEEEIQEEEEVCRVRVQEDRVE